MGEPTPPSDCRCARLRDRIAFNLLLDECILAALSDATAEMRDAGDPTVSELEHTVRTHRIGIMKQRAILGAVGLDV